MSIWSIYEDGWAGYVTEDSDYDESYDYFKKATKVASDFTKSHPEADRNIVYDAAANAAAYYSEHTEEMKVTASVFIRMKINTALKESKQQEKEDPKVEETEKNKLLDRLNNPIPEDIKLKVIADKREGMTNRTIAEKYGIGESSVSRILKKAKATDNENRRENENVSQAIDSEDEEYEEDEDDECRDLNFCAMPELLQNFVKRERHGTNTEIT